SALLISSAGARRATRTPSAAALRRQRVRRGSEAGITLLLLCGQLFRLRDPPFHPTGQPDFLGNLVGGFRPESRDLPVVEDPEIVELLLDGGRDMVQLREIVGHAARA